MDGVDAMRHEPIQVDYLPRAPGMSQGARAGNTVYLSGQVAFGPDGLVGEGDAQAQAEQIFHNIEQVLQATGATFEDVVKLTCFLVGAEAYAGYAAVKTKYVAADGPAGTAVLVAGLLDPRLLMEVEVVAVTQ
jgi:2-iminobutanoate/2-iminopropanoate deaminase